MIQLCRWIGQIVATWLDLVLRMLERRKQRDRLLELDDYLLSDIGISRQDLLSNSGPTRVEEFWKGRKWLSG